MRRKKCQQDNGGSVGSPAGSVEGGIKSLEARQLLLPATSHETETRHHSTDDVFAQSQKSN